MARIEGVNLPANKRVEYGLTYLYGVGLATSREILKATGISLDKRVHALNDAEVTQIQQALKEYTIEGELRKKVTLDIKRLREIGCYRGDRHKKGLPVRGQRTKTNARTRKGPRKAGGQIKLKKAATKK